MIARPCLAQIPPVNRRRSDHPIRACPDLSTANVQTARHEHGLEQPGTVGHDAVHSEVKQLVHHVFVVDCPGVDGQTGSMGRPDEPGGDDRSRPFAEGQLNAVRAETEGAPEECSETGDRECAWSHRKAGLPAAERTDTTLAGKRERAQAYTIPGVEAIDEVDEGKHAAVGLCIDVESRVGQRVNNSSSEGIVRPQPRYG